MIKQFSDNLNTEVFELMENLCKNTLEHDISSSSDDTQPVKRGRGMPRKEHATWRREADGTYDNRPNDPK